MAEFRPVVKPMINLAMIKAGKLSIKLNKSPVIPIISAIIIEFFLVLFLSKVGTYNAPKPAPKGMIP
jgi:preprotein translocase subunit SecY